MVFQRKPLLLLVWQPFNSGFRHPKIGGDSLVATHTAIPCKSSSKQRRNCCSLTGFGRDVKTSSTWEGSMEALDRANFSNQHVIAVDLHMYRCLLERCISMKSLAEGKRVHASIAERGLERTLIIGNHLVNMYAKCGSVADARRIFDEMLERDVGSWNAMITGFTRHGDGNEALKLFHQMRKQCVKPNRITFIGVLNACARITALTEGKLVHAHIIESGMESDVVVGTALVNMYCKCSSIDKARYVLNRMPKRDVVSWNVMIGGYAQHRQGEESLKLFYQMQKEGTKPDKVTFINVLNACASLTALTEGKLVHAYIVDGGLELDINVGKALVNMYRKCASIGNAHHVFNNMPERDIVSWTAMIAGHVEHGPDGEALKLFEEMLERGVRPNEITFITLLDSCANPAAVAEGKLLHAHIVYSGMESDVIVGTALINMYSKCGRIGDAHFVFDKMPERDVVAWNSMITGCAQHAHGKEALKLFWQMQKEGMNPNKVTFISALNACANLVALMEGKAIHAHIVDSGMESDIIIGNALIDMYAKCGSIEDACYVFHKLPTRDVVSWNAMIAGCGQHGCREEALRLFWQMQHEGLKLDQFTFSTILGVCASLEDLVQGRKVHDLIIKAGLESDVIVGNSLVDMYAKCGSIKDAHDVFRRMPKRDVVSWNAMISGYARHGHGKETLELFQQIEWRGMKPDQFTFSSALNACARLESLAQGKEIHAHIIKTGLESNTFVGAALVDMYAKCGRIQDARDVFHKITKRDVVSWNAMIAGCAQHVLGMEALELFDQMQLEGVKPDQFTLSSVLSICASQVALARGKQIHAYIIKTGFELDVFVGSALVDMYAKCGNIGDAWNVLNSMHTRNVVSWNAMIAGCAHNGLGEEAFELFQQMQEEGMEPDELTFSSILTACSHAGLIYEGHCYFDSMIQEYDIMPTMGHYAIMVDLFSRAGCLKEAEVFINKMPFQPNVVVWMSLLGACRNHGNVQLAECIVGCLFKLEPQNAAGYVLIANMYAASGRWDDQSNVRNLMKDTRMKRGFKIQWD